MKMSIKDMRNFYLPVNLLFLLFLIAPSINIYLEYKNIFIVLLTMGVILLLINVILTVIYYVFIIIFNKIEEKTSKNYNLYDWLGNPRPSIDLKQLLSEAKNFDPKHFKENCHYVKEEIKKQASTIEELKSYKQYLEIKNNSPRLTALQNSSTTIIVAVITAALVTFLNFKDHTRSILIINYIAILVLFVFLNMIIHFLSKEMNRNKLLLMLIDECIAERQDEEKVIKDIMRL